MNIELERRLIIEELNHVTEEWLLKAIKKLLDMDAVDDISEEHAAILDARIDAFESGNAATVSWDEALKRFSREK